MIKSFTVIILEKKNTYIAAYKAAFPHTLPVMTGYLFIGIAFGVMFADEMLHMIAVPDDIFKDTLLYTRIFFLGMIPSIAYNVGAGILRAIGDTKRPLYFLMISGIVNVVLNFIFVVFFEKKLDKILLF